MCLCALTMFAICECLWCVSYHNIMHHDIACILHWTNLFQRQRGFIFVLAGFQLAGCTDSFCFIPNFFPNLLVHRDALVLPRYVNLAGL